MPGTLQCTPCLDCTTPMLSWWPPHSSRGHNGLGHVATPRLNSTKYLQRFRFGIPTFMIYVMLEDGSMLCQIMKYFSKLSKQLRMMPWSMFLLDTQLWINHLVCSFLCSSCMCYLLSPMFWSEMLKEGTLMDSGLATLGSRALLPSSCFAFSN